MLSLDELTAIIATHQLPVSDVEELETGVVIEPAFAMSVNYQTAFTVWQHVRTRISQSLYYPLLTEVWGGARDFFTSYEYWYEQEQAAGLIRDIRPGSIIAAAPHADRSAFLTDQEARRHPYLADAITHEPQRTQDQFGDAPTSDEVQAAVAQYQIKSPVAFERWLFAWERHRFGDAQALRCTDVSYLDWFDAHARQLTLLLIPTPKGWNTLAYLHWYGALTSTTPVAIQFLEHWYRTYQAELVANYGTMLQFVVGRPPTSPEEAFQLAWEQEALAECTLVLPGVSIREHARALLTVDRWFLHERP